MLDVNPSICMDCATQVKNVKAGSSGRFSHIHVDRDSPSHFEDSVSYSILAMNAH